MPGCARRKQDKYTAGIGVYVTGCMLLLILGMGSLANMAVAAPHVPSRIEQVQLRQEEGRSLLDLDVHFAVSQLAKEAIHKGIPLAWTVQIKLQQRGLFWFSTLHEVRIPLVVKYHALLNHYTVENRFTGKRDMFETYRGVLDSLSRLTRIPFPKMADRAVAEYRLAIKLHFEREFLPAPLRPEAYFKSQWDLSSHWFLWPLQK